MALWSNLPGIKPPNSIREFKGVNKQDAFSILDGQATSLKNLTSTDYPAMSVRPGITQQGASLTNVIDGLGVWKDNELHAIAGGVWSRLSGGVWGSLATGLNTINRWSFCNFKGSFTDYNLLGANGVDPVKKYDGSTVSDLLNAPANLNYIDAHDNRVYGAVGSILKFSALRKAEDWTTVDDSGEITIETSDGKDISGLKAGPGHIIVFKNHSTHELYGTGPINYQLKPVTDKIGCVANNSALMVGGVLRFLGHDGIYEYAGGAIPSKGFSLPVQGYVDTINYANRHRSVAGTDGKRYSLAIPTGTNAEPDTLLEYDPQFGTWYVQNYGKFVTTYAYMQEKGYFGASDGTVHQISGTSDNGTAIAWEWISKPFGSGPLSARHNWYRLWLVVDLPTGSTLDVYLSSQPEGDVWTSVKTMTASADIQSQRILIPVGIVANKNWMRIKLVGTGPCTVHEVTNQERIMPMGV